MAGSSSPAPNEIDSILFSVALIDQIRHLQTKIMDPIEEQKERRRRKALAQLKWRRKNLQEYNRKARQYRAKRMQDPAVRKRVNEYQKKYHQRQKDKRIAAASGQL